MNPPGQQLKDENDPSINISDEKLNVNIKKKSVKERIVTIDPDIKILSKYAMKNLDLNSAEDLKNIEGVKSKL